MRHKKYLRMIVLVVVLAAIAGWQIRREYRPPVLKAGARLYAYIANAGDGSVSVVDLVALKAIATIPVGPIPSGLRVLTPRKEIWGVSSLSSLSGGDGGYAWVISAESGRVISRIAVGPFPSAVEFSADGQRAYIASSGSNQIVRIDTATKQISGRARTGRHPWFARPRAGDVLAFVCGAHSLLKATAPAGGSTARREARGASTASYAKVQEP